MAQVAVPTESLFQALLESAPDAVVIVNDHGIIVLANSQTTKLFGYNREELLGRAVDMLLPMDLRAIHQRHRAHYVESPHTRAMGTGLDLWAQRKDGTTFPVEISLSAIPTIAGTLITSVIRDVTERKRAAAELERKVKERTAHLDTLLQLSQEIFSARSMDAVLQRSIRHALALTPDALMGAIYLMEAGSQRLVLRASAGNGPIPLVTFSPDESFVSRALHEHTLRQTSSQAEIMMLFPNRPSDGNGTAPPTGSLAIPLSVHDTPIGMLLLVRSGDPYFSPETCATLNGLARLTAAAFSEEQSFSTAATLTNALARLEEEQRSMAERLNTAEAGMLQAARLAAVGQLAAAVAHEINNPLYAARNCLYLLEEDLQPEQRDNPYLKIARDELGRIAGIIQRMRDFYRPPRGDLVSTDLNRILEETLTLAGLNIRHSSISIMFSPSDLPMVTCDPDQLRQVFLNLMLNAIDAMPNGGHLSVRGFTQGSLVVAEISDTGIGIPADIRDHLFEPFFTTKSSGTGLGLSISAHIVTQHGGKIEIDSIEDQGSTFRVILPIEGGVQ